MAKSSANHGHCSQAILKSLESIVSIFSVFCAFCAFSATPAHAQKALTRAVDARLDAAPYNRQLWGVALIDDQGKLLYGRNQDRLFIPASNTKIIVTAVATALMPPDWTVKTSVYSDGRIDAGVLTGDLVLYGRGDPTMTHHCYAVDTTVAGSCDVDALAKLRALADSLKAHGIRVVRGDLIGDGSYFEPQIVHPAWEAYDLNWWYAAPVSGLGFNDNSIDIKWGPGLEPGAPAQLSFTPDLGDVTLENRTATQSLPGDDIDFFREPSTLHLWAQGSVSSSSKGGTEYFALPDPNLFTARAFRQALSERGISVTGTTRSTTDSLLYRAARTTSALAEVTSRPFRDWVFPILNTSQNWFAEMLLKQVGRKFGKGGSWDEGIAVERRFLIDSIGADSTQFSLSDGSGLSSTNLISPLTFTRVLRFIHHHPHYPVFAAGLPQSGKTGSLHDRFVGTPLEGMVHAKTGSISRVNTLSGFIEIANGRTLTFSVEANNHIQPYNAMLHQIDSVVVALGAGAGAAKKK